MTDRRVQRGADRRAAWRAAAEVLRRHGDYELAAQWDALDRAPQESVLALQTLRAIVAYCDARARGELVSPPGGVKWQKKGKGNR